MQVWSRTSAAHSNYTWDLHDEFDIKSQQIKNKNQIPDSLLLVQRPASHLELLLHVHTQFFPSRETHLLSDTDPLYVAIETEDVEDTVCVHLDGVQSVHHDNRRLSMAAVLARGRRRGSVAWPVVSSSTASHWVTHAATLIGRRSKALIISVVTTSCRTRQRAASQSTETKWPIKKDRWTPGRRTLLENFITAQTSDDNSLCVENLLINSDLTKIQEEETPASKQNIIQVVNRGALSVWESYRTLEDGHPAEPAVSGVCLGWRWHHLWEQKTKEEEKGRKKWQMNMTRYWEQSRLQYEHDNEIPEHLRCGITVNWHLMPEICLWVHRVRWISNLSGWLSKTQRLRLMHASEDWIISIWEPQPTHTFYTPGSKPVIDLSVLNLVQWNGKGSMGMSKMATLIIWFCVNSCQTQAFLIRARPRW